MALTEEQKKVAIEEARIGGGDEYALFISMLLNLDDSQQGKIAEMFGVHIEVTPDGVVIDRISKTEN